MKFIAYDSIENSYRQKQLDYIHELGFDTCEWVATEKVHGSNFSLWPIDGEVRPASRSGFTDGSFFGCQPIVESLREKVLAIGMPVFGEIFGAGIQRGINYGPRRFAAFDILNGDKYLPYDEFIQVCRAHDLETCTFIARGSLNDLLNISPEFVTTMSSVGAQDKAEGFVLKPCEDLRYPDGSRVILKKKSDNFKEHASGPKPKIEVVLTELQQTLYDRAMSYINEERVNSALSKLGDATNFNVVQTEVLDDIRREVAKDMEIDTSTWNSIRKHICNTLSPIIRKRMFNS